MLLRTAELFWLKFVCNSNQLEVKICYENILYSVHGLTLGERRQALIMERQGILLAHRITNSWQCKCQVSASINSNGCVDFRDGMLIEQLTVLLTYFQIMFLNI